IYFHAEENTKLDVLERLMVPGLTLVEIPFNTSCYDQMVNSGALRYITNIALRDSMAAYKGLIENTRGYNSRLLQSIVNNTTEIKRIFATANLYPGGLPNICSHMDKIKVIIIGATGMVGEGVLLECLQNENVSAVLIVNRRHYDLSHPKLKELIVPDFMELEQ